MSLYIYTKTKEDINIFEGIIDFIRKDNLDIFVSVEHKRNFRELNSIKKEMKNTDILLIGSLKSLGISKVDVANELEYFINQKKYLIIAEIETSYEYGLSQPMNKAILKTILDSLLLNNNIVKLDFNKKSNAGRNKMEFPDNWEELYEKWDNEEISSKKFMEESGLKKATFYNMITEYREILKANKDFINKYKLGWNKYKNSKIFLKVDENKIIVYFFIFVIIHITDFSYIYLKYFFLILKFLMV